VAITVDGFRLCHAGAAPYTSGVVMAVNEALVLFKDVAEFTPEAAEFIVLEVAKGASVRELHEAYEDRVPNPIVVNRWRKNYPAFDQVMKEAEAACADSMAYEVVRIADDDSRQSAQARNAIEARKWLAGQLDGRFKSGGGHGGHGGVTINVGERLTDEQLEQIAAGGLPVIEGECE